MGEQSYDGSMVSERIYESLVLKNDGQPQGQDWWRINLREAGPNWAIALRIMMMTNDSDYYY